MRTTTHTRTPAPPPYVRSEYPKFLYKEGAIRPQRVVSAEEEERFLSDGWSTAYIEPAKPPAPKTELELALEQRDATHQRFIAALKDQLSDQMSLVVAELTIEKEKTERLSQSNNDLLDERHKMKEVIAVMTAELETAMRRGDGLVEQLGRAQHEIEELKKKAPVTPKFPGHKPREE